MPRWSARRRRRGDLRDREERTPGRRPVRREEGLAVHRGVPPRQLARLDGAIDELTVHPVVGRQPHRDHEAQQHQPVDAQQRDGEHIRQPLGNAAPERVRLHEAGQEVQQEQVQRHADHKEACGLQEIQFSAAVRVRAPLHLKQTGAGEEKRGR